MRSSLDIAFRALYFQHDRTYLRRKCKERRSDATLFGKRLVVDEEA
jgi:hypothetical protein